MHDLDIAAISKQARGPLKSFSFPRQSESFDLYRAESSDISEIILINQRLALTAERSARRGFLIFSYSPEEFERFLTTSDVYVWRNKTKVIGYAVLFSQMSTDLSILDLHRRMDHIIWESADIRALPNLHYVAQVAIDPSFLPLGTRQAAIEFMDRHLSGKNLFCAVVEKPLADQASLNYLRRLGFERVGTRKLSEFKGMKNFQSGWYLRCDKAGKTLI